jgi:hypothetical protein
MNTTTSTMIATSEGAVAQGPEGAVRDERNQPDDHADGGGVKDVVVRDVAHLVADDPLQLVAFELIDQAAGHRDGRALGFQPRREGVERRRLHDGDPWLREPRGDRHLLDDIMEKGLLIDAHFAGAGDGEQDPIAGGKRDKNPERAGEHHGRRPVDPPGTEEGERIDRALGCMKRAGLEVRAVIDLDRPADDEAETPADRDHEDAKPEGVALVPSDRGVEIRAFENLSGPG